MKTTEIFRKHFGDTAFADFDHPNIEPFFEELNQVCLLNKAKNLTKSN